MGNTNEVNKDRHLAGMVQTLSNIENDMAKEIGKSNCFPHKFSTTIFYFMESRVICEVIFPSHTIHFRVVKKKKKKKRGSFSQQRSPNARREHFLTKAIWILLLPHPSLRTLLIQALPVGWGAVSEREETGTEPPLPWRSPCCCT